MTITAIKTECPSWCKLQADHIKPDGDGGHSGPSWPEVPSMQGTWINGHYCGISISTGSTAEDAMAVYLEAPGVEMTPEQAIQAGRYLIEAGRWALENRVADL
jgi:hypothetical protein